MKALALWLLAGSIALLAVEQGSSLSYQGRLNVAGAPAQGLFDFQFSLWDAAEEGAMVSGLISRASLPVANGRFTTTLDFGGSAFSGGSRWLEIAVRASGGSDPYNTLNPRQQINALPYALHALNAATPTDLTTLSNAIAGLVAQQLATLSNTLRTNLVSGVTVASMHPNDSNLVNQGLSLAITVAAPPWVNGTIINQPSPRTGHSMIWTGEEAIIWGGKSGPASPLASGARFRPANDQWTAVSTISAPSARSGHTAVWTGQEMIVWGGFGSAFLASGGKFHPATQAWTATSPNGAPAERMGHIAVWTGSRMVIWGGRNASGLLNDGAIYDPANNQWSALALPNAPAGRHGATAVWAGDRLLIWGGEGSQGALASGSQLLFNQAGTPTAWQTMATLNAPSARSQHSGIWTGSGFVVWGGANLGALLSDGALYDPSTDTWTAISNQNRPTPRAGHAAAWTGGEMIIWNGSGAAYDPTANAWRTLSNPGPVVQRDQATSAWTGAEFIVFGGLSSGVPISNLQRLNPQPAWHLYRKL